MSRVGSPSTLSTTRGAGSVTVREGAFKSVVKIMVSFAGHCSEGSSLSTTVTVNLHSEELELPLANMLIWTTVGPIGNTLWPMYIE